MSRASNKATEAPETVETVETPEEIMEATEAPEEAPGKTYTVKVIGNDDYCGVGAGGVQFANGKAEKVNERMAAWFREHPGYEVK